MSEEENPTSGSEDPAKAPASPTQFHVNGKTVDLNGVKLLTRDWEQLEKQGVNIFKIGGNTDNISVRAYIMVCGYVFRKANPTITDDDVREMELDHPAMDFAWNKIAFNTTASNRPT